MTGGPLSGVRILDMGHDWACPHAARLLADFGAEVIKVEYLRRLDGMRGGNKVNSAYNRHPRFFQLHRNKLSVTLDLRHPKELDFYKDLVRISDVVMENSRPGVMDRLGLGYDALKGLKPDIILLSMSAFGRTGPDHAYAGYGGTIEALSGIQSLTAYGRDDMPKRIREMDVTNGILGACAVLTALVQRQRTGQGAWIDLSEMEAATSGLIGEHFLELAVNGAASLPVGNRHRSAAPHGCYRCAGEDRWIVLTVQSQAEWERLCGIIGRPDLMHDPRCASPSERVRHHQEIDESITAWTVNQKAIEAVRRLQEAGIASGIVADARDLCDDPHLTARHWFQTIGGRDEARYPGFPFRMEEGGGQLRRRGPDLGEDNTVILRQLLGRADTLTWTDDDIGTAFDPE
ncbi:MAG TPA: CoA transferase [Nitrospiria bacterium]|nr:CoA transferase [Nitrospiria bacterium]